jgi:hypothetical protein
MPTPLEKQVLEDYALALSASDAITPRLSAALIDAISGDSVPTADAILAIVKANAGDQSV